LESLVKEARDCIVDLLQSRGDRCHQAIAVLLWGLISHSTAIAVVSANDLDRMIVEASEAIPKGSFSVRNGNEKTIWAQLTGVLIEIGAIKILKAQSGRSPGVIELIHKDWLRFIPTEPTDEYRLNAINSTSKKKFKSLSEFKASIPQH
jgi:hypothetical protein